MITVYCVLSSWGNATLSTEEPIILLQLRSHLYSEYQQVLVILDQ